MAMFYLKCYNLYLCVFVILCGISFTSSFTDDKLYKTENVHHIAEHSLIIEQDSEHSHQKRDLLPQPYLEYSNNSTESSTTSKDVPISPTKKKAKKTEKVSASFIASDTNVGLQDNLTKNLGENGTGIRNIVSTSHPTTVADVDDTESTQNKTDSDDTGINMPKYPSEIDTEEGGKKFNETLKNHNITNSKQDFNLFYNSTINDDVTLGQYYWVNMTNRSDVKVNALLSQSHRRAATIKLSFDFPFYGHLIKNVTIATGGFLYTGDYVHSWLAATQYIAPLMANFDTSISNDSFIKFVDNGTAFTVEWEKVTLQDKPDEGDFTFQVTLFNNGDIVFVYKVVPLLVNEIQEHHHPVKVGLSDAYIMDQTVFLVRRKTIYEYNRVNFNKTYIKNLTSIYLKALPTCLDSRDCVSCLTRKLASFKCQWCPTMNKCSEGYDRYRQDWLAQGCDKKSFVNASTCSSTNESDDFESGLTYNEDSNVDDNYLGDQPYAGKVLLQKQQNMGLSGILAILFLIAMVFGLTSWVFYAYRNPHTFSGQMLIRYRPSQWRWRRGEARYTAATIHM